MVQLRTILSLSTFFGVVQFMRTDPAHNNLDCISASCFLFINSQLFRDRRVASCWCLISCASSENSRWRINQVSPNRDTNQLETWFRCEFHQHDGGSFSNPFICQLLVATEQPDNNRSRPPIVREVPQTVQLSHDTHEIRVVLVLAADVPHPLVHFKESRRVHPYPSYFGDTEAEVHHLIDELKRDTWDDCHTLSAMLDREVLAWPVYTNTVLQRTAAALGIPLKRRRSFDAQELLEVFQSLRRRAVWLPRDRSPVP